MAARAMWKGVLRIGDLQVTRFLDAGSIERADLDRLSKAELYERARAMDVPGRSAMNKRELVRAIREAS